MKVKLIYLSIIALVTICVTFVTIAQQPSKSDLEKTKKQKQQEIQQLKNHIATNKNSQNQSLFVLQSLTRQIYNREAIISNLGNQVGLLENELITIEDSIKILESSLKQQKLKLSKMVVSAYKNRDHYNKLIYIFSAESFNQAVNRIKYYKSLAEQRKSQLGKIKSTRTILSDKQKRLSFTKDDKELTIKEKENEKSALQTDRSEQTEVLSQLKGQEKELQKQLNERKKTMAQLDKAINDIIRKEIEEARRKQREAEAAEKRRKEEEKKKRLEQQQKEGTDSKNANKEKEDDKPDLPTHAPIDPITSGFAANRNRLPWPVAKGLIVSTFGVHAHPNLKNIVVENNGVDISTAPGSSVSAVYKGTVKAVVTIPGLQKMVMVSHGNYYTVYCHLENVTVKVGDVVNAKQSLGTVYTDASENITIVHFEVWKDTNKLNPEDWLGN